MVHNQQLVEQYQTSANLDVRIDIHERFSTNPYRWMCWVFDHFKFPPACRILEVGCGVGKLWLENAQRIGADWEITLSDFSAGMLEKTQANLVNVQGRFDFKVFGVEDIPFGPATFDAVIANHMLYYTADLDRALSEIRRVLKPNGTLYASTNGLNHLREMDDLILDFRGGSRPVASVVEAFSLDQGHDFLGRHFDVVQLDRQENGLRVDDPAALTAFCLSMSRAGIPEEKQPAFADYVERRIRECGVEMRIVKDVGLFACRQVRVPSGAIIN